MTYKTLAIILALTASSAYAQETPRRTRPDPDQIVCKREPRSQGTLITKRVCRPQREWEEISEQSRSQYVKRRDSMRQVRDY